MINDDKDKLIISYNRDEDSFHLVFAYSLV